MTNLIQHHHRPASLQRNYSPPVVRIMKLVMKKGWWWWWPRIPLSGAPNGLQIWPPNEEQEVTAAPYRKTRWILLSDFFLPECEYIELELGSEEVQGAHKPPGRAPQACGQWVDPLWLILSPVFFINSKNILRRFSGQSENFYFCTKITPRQFCWKQCQSGLVQFKSCKLESKTRAKEFGKVDTMETYHLAFMPYVQIRFILMAYA